MPSRFCCLQDHCGQRLGKNMTERYRFFLSFFDIWRQYFA